MPHYGLLHDHKLENVDDLRGAEVYGVNDEKLGTIDDVIFDHSNGEIRYILLKTGGMLSGKRIMVPANRVEPYGHHDDKFYAELDKERLEMLPEFHDETMKSESDWADFERKYEERWKDGTVMYNQDTGRIVTPPAEEQPQASGQTEQRPTGQQLRDIATRNLTPERMGHEDDYLGVASGNDKITLHPKKPSIAGRESVANIARESAKARRESAGIGEPGVYTLDAVPETRPTPDVKRDINESPNQALNATYGRRWMQFQQKLRERRDQVVSGCTLCGTQDKAA